MCRQSLVLGDTAAVGVLVGGLLAKSGEEDDGNNHSETASLLGLELYFELLVAENQDFTAEIRRGGPGAS